MIMIKQKNPYISPPMTGLPPPKTYLSERLAQYNNPTAANRAEERAYVPGMGRGASGFTTTPDIGLSFGSNGPGGAVVQPRQVTKRKVELFGPAPVGYVGGRGRGIGGNIGSQLDGAGRSWEERTGKKVRFDQKVEAEDDTGEGGGVGGYDEWSGMSGDTLASAVYDNDDKEADEIWAAVDDRMDERRRDNREVQKKLERKQFRGAQPKIAAQFADLKSELSSVSEDDWAAIPESGDYSRRNRGVREKIKLRRAHASAAPDSLIQSVRDGEASATTIDVSSAPSSSIMSLESAGATTTAGTETDLTQVGQARNSMLGVQLDKMSDSVSGQTVVDPKGYLTSLGGLKITSSAEVGDIRKARLLLKSVTDTNPKHPPGWIAAARLEEVVGKLKDARMLIMRGRTQCPNSEDIWLEFSRLSDPKEAGNVLDEAVKKCPKSVRIWLRASELKSKLDEKRRVLQNALNEIPNSVILWKQRISLEDSEIGAQALLERATECVPHSVDMWLALARLKPYEEAKKVLNAAVQHVWSDPKIWVMGAMIEESQGNDGIHVIRHAVKTLKNTVDRSTWLKEAETCEHMDPPATKTCQWIISTTIDIEIEKEDRKATYVEDADNAISNKSFESARAIYAHALAQFPTSQSLWMKAVDLERMQGRREEQLTLLKKALEHCPRSENLWILAAKLQWEMGDVNETRKILHAAFEKNQNSEEIWLAAVKLEHSNDENERAKQLLARARKNCSTARVWMKSAMFARATGQEKMEEELLAEAVRLFPRSSKLWMMYGQHYERKNEFDKAGEQYKLGIENCMDESSIPIFLCLSKLKLKDIDADDSVGKARAVLDRGKKRHPTSPELWLASIRFEVEVAERVEDGMKRAGVILAEALKHCQHGLLLAEKIRLAPQRQKKDAAKQALDSMSDDCHVLSAVGELFRSSGDLKRARTWFNRAVTEEPDFGDGWAHLYSVRTDKQGEGDADATFSGERIIERCLSADPHRGQRWIAVSKSMDALKHRYSTKYILESVAKGIDEEFNAFKKRAD